MGKEAFTLPPIESSPGHNLKPRPHGSGLHLTLLTQGESFSFDATSPETQSLIHEAYSRLLSYGHLSIIRHHLASGASHFPDIPIDLGQHKSPLIVCSHVSATSLVPLSPQTVTDAIRLLTPLVQRLGIERYSDLALSFMQDQDQNKPKKPKLIKSGVIVVTTVIVVAILIVIAILGWLFGGEKEEEKKLEGHGIELVQFPDFQFSDSSESLASNPIIFKAWTTKEKDEITSFEVISFTCSATGPGNVFGGGQRNKNVDNDAKTRDVPSQTGFLDIHLRNSVEAALGFKEYPGATYTLTVKVKATCKCKNGKLESEGTQTWDAK